jgi:magnesium chelatase family protein
MLGESKLSPRAIQNYLCRISGPLLDLVDLQVVVPAVKFREISGDRMGETSAHIRERVVAARSRQQTRFTHKPKITCHAGMGPEELKDLFAFDGTAQELLMFALAGSHFSARQDCA